jgi:hypothetical protein
VCSMYACSVSELKKDSKFRWFAFIHSSVRLTSEGSMNDGLQTRKSMYFMPRRSYLLFNLVKSSVMVKIHELYSAKWNCMGNARLQCEAGKCNNSKGPIQLLVACSLPAGLMCHGIWMGMVHHYSGSSE